MKKLIITLVTAATIIAAITGCSQKKAEDDKPNFTMPPTVVEPEEDENAAIRDQAAQASGKRVQQKMEKDKLKYTEALSGDDVKEIKSAVSEYIMEQHSQEVTDFMWADGDDEIYVEAKKEPGEIIVVKCKTETDAYTVVLLKGKDGWKIR